MEWIQSIIASVLTVFLTQAVTILRDHLKHKHDDKQQKEEFTRQKEIQKAENLYRIIKPALHNAQVKTWIFDKGSYDEDAFKFFYEDFKNNNSDYGQFQHWQNLFKCIKDIQFREGNTLYQYIDNLMLNDIYADIQDFKARYVIVENHKIIRIDIEKLNKDIKFINQTLDLYIETYVEDNK